MIGRPAGWFRDPAPRDPLAPDTWRYWNGISWTAQTRSGTKRQRREWREQVAAEQREHLRDLYERAQLGDEDAHAQLMGLSDRAGARGSQRGAGGDRFGGWWARYGAHLVDYWVLGIAATLLALPFFQRFVTELSRYFEAAVLASQRGDVPPSPEALLERITGPWVAMMGISLIVSLVYEAGFLKACSATPGKMLLGLQVRPRDLDAPLSWRAAVLRAVGKYGVGVVYLVPVVMFLGGLYTLVDFLWPLGDRNRQSLHDKLARTYVVRRA
jgi:uncharacterized RDD family membrane protein YckC